MRHPIRTSLLVFAAVALLTGCSWSQVFRLSVTVVDKTDGNPISEADVQLDPFPRAEERKDDPIPKDTGLRTDVGGRLEHDLSISGYTPTASGDERWYLKVRKAGYEPVVIDIKPDPLPERSPDKPTPLSVRVELRPLGKPPG
jgi:hypothetical protein